MGRVFPLGGTGPEGGRKQELRALLIIGFVGDSAGRHYKTYIPKCYVWRIPILQKTEEGSGCRHRRAESRAALRAEPQYLSP